MSICHLAIRRVRPSSWPRDRRWASPRSAPRWQPWRRGPGRAPRKTTTSVALEQRRAMCAHQPSCPPADHRDRDAARTVAFHPEQGWSLLCNGVIVFDDMGEILPGDRVIPPHRPPASGCPSPRETRELEEDHHAPNVRDVVHRDRRRRPGGRGTGHEAPRACGQARQISPGQEGCRCSTGSPASPLRYEPAPHRWRVSLPCKRDRATSAAIQLFARPIRHHAGGPDRHRS